MSELNCNLHKFSDLLSINRDISVDDYFLLVESLDTDVGAFAPMLASHHPRVIAVGESNGDLLRVTMLLSEECRMRRNIPMGKARRRPPDRWRVHWLQCKLTSALRSRRVGRTRCRTMELEERERADVTATSTTCRTF